MTRKRRNFSKGVLARRFQFCGGRCEGVRVHEDGTRYRCNAVLVPGRWHGDHDNPDGLTGEPTFENCRCLCLDCHATKTAKDKGDIAEAKRREFREARPRVDPARPLQSRNNLPKGKTRRVPQLPLPPRTNVPEGKCW